MAPPHTVHLPLGALLIWRTVCGTGRLLSGDARPKSEHLVRAAGCELAVDTLSYNSHTTGADALWAGLPLLTLPGAYFSSRVGASLAAAAGVPQSHLGPHMVHSHTVHLALADVC